MKSAQVSLRVAIAILGGLAATPPAHAEPTEAPPNDAFGFMPQEGPQVHPSAGSHTEDGPVGTEEETPTTEAEQIATLTAELCNTDDHVDCSPD